MTSSSPRDRSTRSRVSVVAAAVAAEHETPLGHVGDERDRPGEHGHDGADEDVPVLDVTELMCQNAVQLVLVEDAQQPFVDADRSVRGVAAGREGVG
jgi:hypothetical protein